ncbi:hypothetical protein TH53_15770 [Pedobacter lusitanus]|uniref:Uncharacterized protein n=1 Tax=Pedobacter lusitanus TaxID=1503925 RepID=A0A0D0GPA3_9SPHI|nr:hypothetical protein [Pedobacter lusitanus]KIO76306.1 hypothetical protein TH53_15770 [Pedobacter lusitanus]
MAPACIGINTDSNTKELVVKGIDDAAYGLIMIMDGVTGCLQNDQYSVFIESIIKHFKLQT